MELEGTHVVVTGAAGGIGRALAARFVAGGARAVVAADVDAEAVRTTASEIGARAAVVDVTRESEIVALIDEAEERDGPIDLFCSNAGVSGPIGGPETDDAAWDLLWNVHVMAHVWAARALVPRMRARGGGHLLNTASAAGLLTNVGVLPYSVTKHASVALAEWLAITYGSDGIGVSCLCPQAVGTPLLEGLLEGGLAALYEQTGATLTAEEVAECTVEGLASGAFLILPHGEVASYMAHRGADHERWLAAVRRLSDQVLGT
jgi:NAD(P)-dependent dehydrogenase (short-subunit alcohol dehydrogenase family)